MFKNLFRSDYRQSRPHLLLLSKFLDARDPSRFARDESWAEVLREPADKVIKRFVNDRLLQKPDLLSLVSLKFKATELKNLVKARSLPVSGKKDELVARLVAADPDSMRRAVADLNALECTEEGRVLASAYLEKEAMARQGALNEVIAFIRAGQYRGAIQRHAQYESTQVFPSGINVDWKNYNTSHSENAIHLILTRVPAALGKIDAERLQQMRLAAILKEIWPTPNPFEDLGIEVPLDEKKTYNKEMHLLLGHAYFHRELASIKKAGIRRVKILTCNDEHVCQECKRIAAGTHKLNEVPELPYVRCNCEMGCRCGIAAAVLNE